MYRKPVEKMERVFDDGTDRLKMNFCGGIQQGIHKDMRSAGKRVWKGLGKGVNSGSEVKNGMFTST